MISTDEEISRIILQLKKYFIKNALDLGCGKGRIALKLAENGINVLGIDVKNVLIKNEKFTFIKEDIRNFKFEKKFDLIVCSLILHFFKNKFAIQTIKNIQESTASNGINFFILMSNKDDLSRSKSENFYPDLEQMKKIYSGWEVLTEIQDYTDIENHDNLGDHKHNLIFLVFRKNN